MSSSTQVISVTREVGKVVFQQQSAADVEILLNETGPGFCLAKFTQVTMHLGTGLVHSCHHPTPHKIDPILVEENPSLLFNTPQLQAARLEMLAGKRPKECEYCWRIEDTGGTSDRVYKSKEEWALPHHDAAKTQDVGGWFPTYLEVDFSNVCNFACTYCGPEYSSKWTEELKRFGPIKMLQGTKHASWAQGWQNLDQLAIPNNQHNPYITAFWKWFPNAYPHLKVYRITGGEPLLSKETFKTIEWMLDHPNGELEFNINTNMGVPDPLWDKFVDKMAQLANTKNMKRITIFTSVDGWGPQAEYARTGLDFEVFKRRYEQILKLGNIRCVIMCTFNIFSVTTFKKLLEWHVVLKRKYNIDSEKTTLEAETNLNLSDGISYSERSRKNEGFGGAIVGIDTPYLRHPSFLDAINMTPNMVAQYLIPALDFMAQNGINSVWGRHQGFETYEVDRFKRLVVSLLKQVKETPSVEVIANRARFADFVAEIDIRRGTKFIDVFPEMTEFYELCLAAKQQVHSESVA